jgi:hypothetical protein
MTCAENTPFLGSLQECVGKAADGQQGPAIDVASLSHLAKITSALWKRFSIADYVEVAAGICVMLQIDPWIKAAECERAIRIVADPERRSVLISLQGIWVALGNEQFVFDRFGQKGCVPMIAQIHVELMSFYRKRYELT